MSARQVLVATASLVALSASGALATGRFSAAASQFSIAKGARVLYNQNSNDAGTVVTSQNFSETSYYDTQSADDFVIPAGRIWKITEVDVTGQYFNGSGGVYSEDVVFYQNKDGIPGSPVRNGVFSSINGGSGPSFAIKLPGKGVRLRAGRYWVSVITNVEWPYGPEWGWEVNGTRHGKQAMWQNPSGYFGTCKTWGTIESCVEAGGPDLMFALKGTRKRIAK